MLTLVTTGAFAVPLETLVSADTAARLRASDELILETQLRNPSLRLLPQNAELRQFVNTASQSLNPGMMVEALYLYRKPAGFHTSASNWDEGQKLRIFNQLTAISTLAGIQYYSSSRGVMRTFYESSGVIDSATNRNPLPDPVFTQIPLMLSLHARQKDLTFGDNIYNYNYVNTRDALFFSQENVTALSYGIIPAIGRGNLRSIISIFDCGDSILVYAVSMARASTLPGMGDRISNSFGNRADAVLKWLSGRLNNEVFGRI
ncbi:MAG: hypothetical protein FWD14_05605 [Treponema sp.]|nr:hypothetical protein [Treponema sp.]